MTEAVQGEELPVSRDEEADTIAPRPTGFEYALPAVRVDERRETHVHLLLWQAYGTAHVTVEGRSHDLERGQALWIPAGRRHHFTVHRNSVLTPLFFAIEEVDFASEPIVVEISGTLAVLLLAHDVATHTLIEPETETRRHIFDAIERSLEPDVRPPMPSSPAARRVAECLLADPADRRGVVELAAWAHSSPRSLQRAFASETGATFREWRIRSRVDAAAGLLRRGCTVEAAAHGVGYTNVNAFRRVFLTRFGLSPTAYAERVLAG